MRLINHITLLFASSLWSCHALADWPSLPFPRHAKVESIGERVVLNGVPMQMHRMLSNEHPLKIQQFYQRHLGPRHTKTEYEGGIILAQGRNQHFITIRISPVAKGVTETLTTVSDVAAAKANQGRALGIQLPAHSQVLSDMESFDQGKSARQLVYQNQHSMQTNIAFLIEVLKQRGYALQPTSQSANTQDQVLMFDGKQREARLVVHPQEQGSNVVLTMVQAQP
jgi:hypothetical protein